MNVLLMSDSHGKANVVRQILSEVPHDHVIHCGDFCTRRGELPSNGITMVKGNCDTEPVREEIVKEVRGIRFLITHGHRYQVKSSLLSLRYRAEEIGADVICFGHSHVPVCEWVDHKLYINPGSLAKPRQFPYPTYVRLKLQSNELHVTFYGLQHDEIPGMGGTFSFSKK